MLVAGTACGELLAKKSLSPEDAVNAGQNAILSFPNILPSKGGVPFAVDGEVVGAIGVGGGKSSEDLEVAKAGADALAK